MATAQHLTDLGIALSEAGWQVTVLTRRRGYAEPHLLFPSREKYRGIDIVRVCSFYFSKKNKILRTMDALLVNFSFAARMAFLPKVDRVVVLTSPPLIAFTAVIYAKLCRAKLTYWMMDINPDEAIEAGWIRRESLQARILERILRFVLKKAGQIVVLDRFMRDRIVEKGTSPEKIKVCPPWAHSDGLRPIAHSRNSFRKEHQLQDKFVVMYSGNHSICHPLDTLLESALLLRDDPTVVFLFIGGGERVRDVVQFKAKYHLDNIVQMPYVAREHLPNSLSAADLHVVVMGSPYVGIVHPSKIYGILCVGRPFVYIGPLQSPIGELMGKGKVGYHINDGGPQKVIEIIKKVQQLTPPESEELGKRLQAIGKRQYSQELLTRRLVKFISN